MTLGNRPSRRPTRPLRFTLKVEPYDIGVLAPLRRAVASSNIESQRAIPAEPATRRTGDAKS
jgi:hypothetical protein